MNSSFTRKSTEQLFVENEPTPGGWSLFPRFLCWMAKWMWQLLVIKMINKQWWIPQSELWICMHCATVVLCLHTGDYFLFLPPRIRIDWCLPVHQMRCKYRAAARASFYGEAFLSLPFSVSCGVVFAIMWPLKAKLWALTTMPINYLPNNSSLKQEVISFTLQCV